MSAGDIVGLIAVGVFAIFVAICAVPILKLGKVFDELGEAIHDVGEETTPLMEEITSTVSTAHEQLKKVDGMTSNVSDATAHLSALSSLLTAVVGTPLIKAASFSAGLRQAAKQRSRNSRARHGRRA